MTLPREAFVGTVFEDHVLLLQVIGEGKDHVVFRSGDPITGKELGRVTKFVKPHAFLEMSVLHHRFRVHPSWNEHPLKLEPEERARRLRAEMVQRIQSGELPYRCKLIRRLYLRLIDRLMGYVRSATEDFHKDASGEVRMVVDTSPSRIEAVVSQRINEDKGVIPFRDEVLRNLLEEKLEEGGLEEVDELVVRFALKSLRALRPHPSIASDVIVGALALLDEDFISKDEFFNLLNSGEFRAIARDVHPLVLRDFVKVLLCELSNAHQTLHALRARHRQMLEQLKEQPIEVPGRHYDSGLSIEAHTIGPEAYAEAFRMQEQQQAWDSEALDERLQLALHLHASLMEDAASDPRLASHVATARRWSADLDELQNDVFKPNPEFRVWNPFHIESVPLGETPPD